MGSVTFAVSNLDDQVASLKRLGNDPGRVMITKTAKVVMIKDPDGNSIAFGEATDSNAAQ